MRRMSLYDVLLMQRNSNIKQELPVININEFESTRQLSEKCHLLSTMTKNLIREFKIEPHEVAINLHVGVEPNSPSIIFLKSMYSNYTDEPPLKILFVPNKHDSYIIVSHKKLGKIKFNDLTSFGHQIIKWKDIDKSILLNLQERKISADIWL